MNAPMIPGMLGTLLHDIILVCDSNGIVLEANALARHMMHADIVGKPITSLFAEQSVQKGISFIQELLAKDVGETTICWELFLHVHHSVPITVNFRGGRQEHDRWILVGACESPKLTELYHEVLAMNSELTNLIRRLSKEQADLNARLNRLLDKKGNHNDCDEQ